MKIYDSTRNPDTIEKGWSLAIGNFDGVHLGHLEILKAAFDQEMSGYEEMGVISSRMYPDWFDSPEGKEGGNAFVAKRKPRFWELRKRTAEKHKELIDRYEDEESD